MHTVNVHSSPSRRTRMRPFDVNRTCVHLKKWRLSFRYPKFIVDYNIENVPVCGAMTRVAAAMVSEMRVLAAANVVELFVQTIVVLQNTSILVSGLVTWL
ncbi:hypothetical protein TNCV_2303951 [Trichonephila clavipes]|nr:hypothetical protein TNCV_2303951 [Trichonephila clavipes]